MPPLSLSGETAIELLGETMMDSVPRERTTRPVSPVSTTAPGATVPFGVRDTGIAPSVWM